MLTTVKAGPYTIRGVSVGGVYTSLHVPELGVMLDVGVSPRSFAGVPTLCLSHGHVDHAGALASLLGIRALMGGKKALRVLAPAPIVDPLERALAAMTEMQRWPLEIEAVPMQPGDVVSLRKDLSVRAFRTYHPVPSLGYQFFRTVDKLKPAYADRPGHEIARRRLAGEPIFDVVEQRELAYATDTLARVLDAEPSICDSRVLVLECTFLDQRKSLQATHAGCHIHLDEIIERADQLHNEHIVLMHFSQIYKPHEIAKIIANRCPPHLAERIVPFVYQHDDWPG